MPESQKKTSWAQGRYLVALLALVILALAPGLAKAHKVNVFAYVEEGSIKGEGYFAGGDKAQSALVEIVDSQGRILGSAQTNGQGLFSLERPADATGPLRVVLKAGQGHQGEYTLGAAELGGAAAPAPTAQTPGTPVQTAASGAAPLPAELEERLGRLLDQRLQPLTAQVAKLAGERGVGLPDVVGGLGYILGLMGLAAYLKSRERR
ncbi:MAG: hypothetical protein HY910_09655 [Desulfarculus sp.]|nr:hypothetical protein [Desulfarculus sp.]